MKSIEEQKAEKALRIAELIKEQAELFVQYLNPDTPEDLKQKVAIRLLIIMEVELPMVISQPIQRKEFPKGGVTVMGEHGSEYITFGKPKLLSNLNTMPIPNCTHPEMIPAPRTPFHGSDMVKACGKCGMRFE